MPKLSKEFRELNLKQKNFVKAFVRNGGNLTDASMEAYDHKTRQSAATHGSQLVKKPHIKNAILQAYERLNIDENWILQRQKQLIDKGFTDLPMQKVTPELLHKGLLSLSDTLERARDKQDVEKRQLSHQSKSQLGVTRNQQNNFFTLIEKE